MQFIAQIQYLLLNIIMNEIFSGDLECDYTKGENDCIAMHFIIYTWAYRYRLHVMIITEHPAYPYLATDVARCRDGDVSRVSLKYDAAECSPGLLSMEWYPSLFLDAAKCSPRLVTHSVGFSTSWFFHAGTPVL